MRQLRPLSLTVLIDKSENNPLVFPKQCLLYNDWDGRLTRIHTKDVKLPTADYTIEGFEDLVLVERKADVNELYKNFFTKDRRRFQKCLERMIASPATTYLFLECPTSEFRTPTKYVDAPEMVLDKVLRACAACDVRLLWYPLPKNVHTAERAGEFVLRTMWATVLARQ